MKEWPHDFSENAVRLNGNLLILNFYPMLGMRARYKGKTYRVTDYDDDMIVLEPCPLVNQGVYATPAGHEMVQGVYMVRA